LIPWLCFWWQGIEVLFELNREEEEEKEEEEDFDPAVRHPSWLLRTS
jgi:hypothetical protein